MSDRSWRIGALMLVNAFTTPASAAAQAEMSRFTDKAFIEAPETVACTLENVTTSQCHRITVGYLPEGLEIGPFCPATLDEAGGVWDWTGQQAGLYRVDIDFFMLLDKLGYRFFDDDGTVHVVDIATSQPTVDHACINVAADESVEITMLLPVEPVFADEPAALGTVAKVGVALDGVPIFADAPSIQQTGHMPALDVCGGHIDPGGWYHWHATSTDIESVFEAEEVDADCALPQEASALFGYAFDGFAMYGSRDAGGVIPSDLDACNGHVGATADGVDAYHYHASESFPNLPPCLVGVQARDNFSTTATAGVGATRRGADGRNEPPRPGAGGRPGPGGVPPGFEEAAQSLGVSLDALMQAVTAAGGPRLDYVAAAAALGVTEERLRAALPPRAGG